MKKNNKGFTLVELIVVLVILAILAAILVPALLGYIDRAKEKQYVLNAKSYLTAAQAEMSSLYGEGKTAADVTSRKDTIEKTADVSATNVEIGFKCDASHTATKAGKDYHDAFTIKYMKYEENGYKLFFDGDSWQTVTDYPSVTGVQWIDIK